MSNWRLTVGVTAVLVTPYEEHGVYLCSSEKKAYRSLLERKINILEYTTLRKEVLIEDNEFEVKIVPHPVSGYTVKIKHDSFPDKDAWYTVKNIQESDIIDLIYYGGMNDSVLTGKYEAIFSDEDDCKTSVSFISSRLPKYKECFEEFRRRLNCELLKKTKKMIPGHRYDSISESRYILCKALYRKQKDNLSDCLTDILTMPEVYLYVTSLGDNDKSISDVLRTRKIGDGKNDIHISRVFTPLVDCGEVLSDDFTGKIDDYWEDLTNNAMSSSRTPFEIETGFIHILNTLSLVSNSEKVSVVDKEGLLTKVLTYIVDNIILENYDLTHGIASLVISSKNTLSDNVKNCANILFNTIGDPNVNRTDYYTTLFNTFGISLEKIAEQRLIYWNPAALSKDFDTFMNNTRYFSLRGSHKVYRQRLNSTNYKLDVNRICDDFSVVLSEAIIELLNYARKNCGYGIERFAIYNVGTKSSPKEYISASLNVKDIVSYYGDRISENLKKEIVDSKFTDIAIEFDKDITLE